MNQRLINNTGLFLSQIAVNPGGGVNRFTPAAPIVDVNHTAVFDLVPCPGGVQLQSWVNHPKTHKHGTQHPLRAYWLDYDPAGVASVQLGAHADFVFTPLIDGCYIAVGAGANPIVAHVPGDDRTGNPRTVPQLTAAATAAVGAVIAHSFNSNAAVYTAECYTFIGHKTNGVWAYYAQGHSYDSGGSVLALQAMGPAIPARYIAF